MMNFKEVFNDFIELVYRNKNNVLLSNTLIDYDLDNYIIIRIYEEDCKILYLYSGSSLVIPIEWINLFSEFNSYSGSRFLNEYSELDFEDKNIEEIGYLFTFFCSILSDRRLLCNKNNEILEILGDICSITTKEFRNWCSDEFKIELSPLIYNDLKLEYSRKYI